MKKKYDFGVYIGRFQPLHNGHVNTIKRMWEECNRVIILVGSSNVARSPKNPFTFEERREMIRMEFPQKRVHIEHLDDHTYDNAAWFADVHSRVKAYTMDYGAGNDFTVALYGHHKDETSFYFEQFPQWVKIDTGEYDDEILSATEIRKHYFYSKLRLDIKPVYSFLSGTVPASVLTYLKNFEKTDNFHTLRQWENFNQNYDPSVFKNDIVVCVDAVVIQSGHILLIQRKDHPGKGLWAMPGGHVNNDETIETAVLRELREETNLRVPAKVIDGSIVPPEDNKGEIDLGKCRLFDDVNRSQRARVITFAFKIELDGTKELPRVSGSDDAAHAKWFPLGEFEEMGEKMFEDHYFIIKRML